MNNATNFAAGQTGPSAAMAFDYSQIITRRHPRPEPWLQIFNNLLAFVAGCLIALAFGLADDTLDTFSATPKTHVFHRQTVQAAPGHAAQPRSSAVAPDHD